MTGSEKIGSAPRMTAWGREQPCLRSAVLLATADARFPNGRFQSVQIIGVGDATLTGVPLMIGGATAAVLRIPDAL